MPSMIRIDYNQCRRRRKGNEAAKEGAKAAKMRAAAAATLPVAASPSIDLIVGEEEEEEEEEERVKEKGLVERGKVKAVILSSDAPFVGNNQTKAAMVIAEDQYIYDNFADKTSEEGYSFR